MMVASIKKNIELYPYTLDLVAGKVLFFDIQAKNKPKQIVVDIQDLKSELLKLKQNIEDFDGLIHS